MARAIYEIATEIKQTWPKMYFGAAPYVEAMSGLADPEDTYFQDTGFDIVQRFLINARTWRGEDARRIKAELKELIK